MSLRWKFALLFAGGAALATLLVALAAFVTTRRALDSETDAFLQERAAALAVAFSFAELLEMVDADDPVEIQVRGRNRDGDQDPFLGIAEILIGPDAVFRWSDLKTEKPLVILGGTPQLPILYPEKPTHHTVKE